MQTQSNSKTRNSKHTALIEVRSAHVAFGTTEVLRDVSLSVQPGDRIGLVGPNGAGKSTLLKLLAGEIKADTGTVTFDKNGASGDRAVGYLPQIPATDIRAAENKSGGEKTKMILSKLFGALHSVYLLDEPTNNLDSEGLAWLAHEIGKPSNEAAAFVIVSHDRDFLDKTVNKIIEVNEHDHTVRQFECTFSEYRDIRAREIEGQWKQYEESVEEKGRLKKSVDQRKEWTRKIERTRANNRKLDPGEKEKPPAAYLRDKEGRMGQRVKAVQKRFDKAVGELADMAKPVAKLPINLSFEGVERSGEVVFKMRDITFSYESASDMRAAPHAIGPIDLEVSYGDRIHIVGKNGSGKTTLLKILLGELKLATGEAGSETKAAEDKGTGSGEIQRGTRLRIGYLPQEDAFDADENMIDAVFRVLGLERDDEQEGLFRMTLKRFGFEEHDAKKSIGQLSSGERTRLRLALMKMMKPNCIILDEPTNHLDIEGVEALEKALKEFEGTLIVASHDARFVGEVGLTREFRL